MTEHYVDTGLNLVDVRDVAHVHWLALQHGRPGERYLLVSENLSLRRILEVLASISGRRAPRVRLPYWAAYVAGIASTGYSRASGKTPSVPLEAVRMARKSMYANSDKARRELGFRPAPVINALERAVGWFESTAGEPGRHQARR